MIRVYIRLMGLALLGSVVALSGCDDGDGKTAGGGGGADQKGAAAKATIPAGLILDAEPAGAKNVVDVKGKVKAGDEVVVRGVVAGNSDPVAAGQAMLTVADPSLETCDKTEDDACPTPWDACCASAEERVAKSISVQVVGADGRPVQGSLRGVGGIEPMSRVVVRGKVAEVDEHVLVVNADGIYVVKG